MLVFLWRKENRKTYPEKNPRSKAITNNKKTQPTYGAGPESNPSHIVEGERSHHCVIPAPRILFAEEEHMSFMMRESREFADVQVIFLCILTILNVTVALLK